MSAQTSSNNNKRIAKNTIFLYIRMLLLMGITLFTSRVVLDKLGVDDFGIYNVVGGLATMFVFFQSSLANTTQRYLNIELGKNDLVGANHVFCQNLILYGLITGVVLLLGETVGLWFVMTKLNIPDNRLTAAIWVYQFTLFALCATLIGIVFNAEIIAHEDMKVYSYIGIFEGIGRLAVAYAISVSSYDRLIVYGCLMMCVSFIVQTAYLIHCRTKYKECQSVRKYWDKNLFKESSVLIGWNTVGTAVYAVNETGVNILLNIFFGPAVNAARAISYQVSGALNSFSNNFFVSVRPQIVKSYAQGNITYMLQLFFNSSKYSFLLMWLLCLPVALSIDQILGIWLKVVPESSGVFTIWVLGYMLVNVLNTPIWSMALAIGKLKRYISIGSGVFLMVFPLSYIALKLGASAVSVFIIMLIIRSVYLIVVLHVIQSYIPYSKVEYLRKVIMPIVYVTIPSLLLAYILRGFIPYTFIGLVTFTVITLLISTISIWLFGINENERKIVKQLLLKNIKYNGTN